MTTEQVTLGGRYVLEDKIAGGGMATVWRARDEVLARSVAVKILHANLAEDEAFVERFRREALAAARLAHPHIVSIYDTGSEEANDDSPSHYIVMEYCSGGTLDDLLQQDGPLDPHRVAAIGATVCDALHYAHQNNIVHRDIKPQNILVSEHGILKVADFGIAKAAFATSDITSTGAILGTVTYLSPEQVNGREPGPASDLYSLGIVLHELTCGRPPFRAETQIATAMAHTRNPPPPLGKMRGGVPRDLERIVLTALQKDPDDRFASAQEMGAALRAIGERSSTSVLPAPPIPSPAPAASGGAATSSRGEPVTSEGRSVLRTIVPLVLFVALAVIASFVIPSLIEGEDDPAGLNGQPGTETAEALEVVGAADFDPQGDGVEHSDDVEAAIDGNRESTWTTESYDTPLEDQKEGVGLVVDLGSEQTIERLEISTPTPGFTFEIRASAETSETIDGFEVVAEETTAELTTSVEFDEPVEAQFLLVWITALGEDGSGHAALAEVTPYGS